MLVPEVEGVLTYQANPDHACPCYQQFVLRSKQGPFYSPFIGNSFDTLYLKPTHHAKLKFLTKNKHLIFTQQ